jgi:ACT domain-containing protein
MKEGYSTMKAIITVLSTDREGIIAQVSGKLYEHGINILDISQTVLSNYFTMVMLVDLSKMKVSFKEMTGLLEKMGEELGMEIRMQRSEIFDAMHRV